MKDALHNRRVLMLVENLSVPTDRRVWQEALSLRRSGFDVTVICPAGVGRDEESLESIEGIEIHRYSAMPSGGGAIGYAREYATALFRIARLIRKLAGARGFDVVHAANPPDLLLLAALPLRRRGARFVFDHHDLAPELYLSRYDRERRDPLYWVLRLCERIAFRLANVVIATNESYRRIAIERGGKSAEAVFVVRNGPDPARFRAVSPDATLSRGMPHLIAYAGMMGPQDGLDHALHALAALKDEREDWHAIFVGEGDVLPAMRNLAAELGLAQKVEFAGFVQQRELVRLLSTADVCIAPEPRNPLNDRSTMIKIAEYMAVGRPIVAFDLVETRATADQAALYAKPNSNSDFARLLGELIGDPQRREHMGEVGKARVREHLSWSHSEESLRAAYEAVCRPHSP